MTPWRLQVRGYDDTLSVRISESTVGLYLCRASVKGFKEVSASASVLMRGPPRILRSQRVQVRQPEQRGEQRECEMRANSHTCTR